jgi:hypothetical protein
LLAHQPSARESQPQQIRVVGDDNLVAKMRTEVRSGRTLHVFFHPNDVGDWTSLQVSDTLRVEASGGGSTLTFE